MAKLPSGARKRADGSLEKRFSVNGKRYSVYGKNAKELQQKETELRKKIESGNYTRNKSLTLDSYFAEWQKNKRGNIKGSTLKSYSSYYQKHISPYVGKSKVSALERRQLISVQQKWTESLSTTTCNAVLRTLKTILNDAVRDEVISRNPAEFLRGLKQTEKKASERHHRALGEDEQKQFMEEMKDDYHYEFCALLLTTGLRCGECAALTWQDIDYVNNVIHITKTVTYTENGSVIIGETPKTESSKRDIPMNSTIKQVLKSQKEKMKLLHGDVIPISNRIFQTVRGNIVQDYAINDAIKKCLGRLEEKGVAIEHFTAHGFRDTFATRYIESGGELQTLKTILGHSSLAMTADLYAHVLPNTKQQEMDNLKIII